jgi:hypothetical protein
LTEKLDARLRLRKRISKGRRKTFAAIKSRSVKERLRHE